MMTFKKVFPVLFLASVCVVLMQGRAMADIAPPAGFGPAFPPPRPMQRPPMPPPVEYPQYVYPAQPRRLRPDEMGDQLVRTNRF